MATLVLAYAAASQTFSLPQGVLSAVCFVESSHNPTVIHKDDGLENSIGLCQVQVSTARMFGYKGTASGLLNPKTNAYYAAAYINHQLRRYKGDLHKAIISYNSGHYVSANQKYLNKVLKAMREKR